MALTGSERTKKHYDANKEAVLARKRERYHAKKLAKVEPVVEPELPNESLIVEIPIELPCESVFILPIDELPNESELIPIDEELPVLEIITNKINSLPDETDGNKLFRIKNFKTIINILNPTNYKEFIKQLRKPNQTIKLIKSFEYKPGKTYASNTLISLYKAILFYFDKFNLKIKQTNKSKYEDQIQMADAVAVVELKQKNTTTIPTFDEYIQAVLNQYGLNSREYLISKLYQEVKCRNDLNLIIADELVALDKLTNYLVIGDNYRVVLNNYKTIDKYGQIDLILSDQLTNLLSHYMENNNILVGDNLFNTNYLSTIVSRVNKKLGFTGHGSINLLRRMLATDASVLPIEGQIKVAREMCHSLKVTNSNYVVKE